MKDIFLTKKKIKIKNISYGTAVLGNYYDICDNNQVSEVLNYAFDSGINYFDTAPLYGFGISEHRLGHYLQQKKRSDFVLSTKVGRLLSPQNISNFERQHVAPRPHFRSASISLKGSNRGIHGECMEIP